VKRNLTFLLEEYNIDGFRFDLTKGFTQKSSSESTASNYDASRIAILKDYNATIKAVKPETYVILEHFCDNQEETELSNNGMMVWRNMNHAFKQSAMGKSASSDLSGLYYGTSRPINSLVSYMESHDEERAAYMQIKEGIGVLRTDLNARMSQLATNAAFFFTVPGPKMIWQFGELGYDISIDENGRVGKKPVKWDYYDEPKRKELYSTYAKLMDLRNKFPQLFIPATPLPLQWKVTTTDWGNGRFLTLTGTDNKHVVVVGNFTNNAGNYTTTFPATGEWYNYMNVSDTLQVNAHTMNITVPANNFKMYTSFSTAGKD
jgi:pullulanase/glycogen debranching enzyme